MSEIFPQWMKILSVKEEGSEGNLTSFKVETSHGVYEFGVKDSVEFKRRIEERIKRDESITPNS